MQRGVHNMGSSPLASLLHSLFNRIPPSSGAASAAEGKRNRLRPGEYRIIGSGIGRDDE